MRKFLVYAIVAPIIFTQIMALIHFCSYEYLSPKQSANTNDKPQQLHEARKTLGEMPRMRENKTFSTKKVFSISWLHNSHPSMGRDEDTPV